MLQVNSRPYAQVKLINLARSRRDWLAYEFRCALIDISLAQQCGQSPYEAKLNNYFEHDRVVCM